MRHAPQVQLQQASGAQADAQHLHQQLSTALQQLQVARGELTVAAERLQAMAQVQKELAAATERGDKLASELAQAGLDTKHLSVELETVRGQAAAMQRECEHLLGEATDAKAAASSKASRNGELPPHTAFAVWAGTW